MKETTDTHLFSLETEIQHVWNKLNTDANVCGVNTGKLGGQIS